MTDAIAAPLEPTARRHGPVAAAVLALLLPLPAGAQDPVLPPPLPLLAPAGTPDGADDLSPLRDAGTTAPAPPPDERGAPDPSAPVAAADPDTAAALAAALARIDPDTLRLIAGLSQAELDALVQLARAQASADAKGAGPAPQAGTATRAPGNDAVIIQIGSFSRDENARVAAALLADRGVATVVVPPGAGSRLHHVRTEPVPPAALQATLRAARAAGFADAFVLPR